MKASLLTALISIYFLACGQVAKTERPGEPDIYSVESEDKEMNEAIEKSRSTFDTFLATFNNPKEEQMSFSVKMPFPTDDGAEHIWLVNIESQDGKLFGEVDNVPENVSSVKLGDKIEIDRHKISDWFYIDGDRLIGGLTIRVLRDRMTPSEKRQFDADFGLKFD
jgi:uncharacterized protein YegJ (DUF2314 family)